jgi:aspartyl-tRNA synthetase
LSVPELSQSATSLRTHLCGEIRAAFSGQTVRLGGWVHRSRDLGGLVFIDLRDRTGLVQLSFDPSRSPEELVRSAAAVGMESTIVVEGVVTLRPMEMRNSELATGDVEIHVGAMEVVGPAATPAIPVALSRDDRLPAEDLRLRYRYLDLRRAQLRENLELRHRLLQAARGFLSARGFLEIETPVLTRPTPEGARDYLVPSRVHPGEFYALPQSPQLYKQLLMVAGFDRYFQIARCFRDEDLRADRQPEFTQIDIEASFITREDIFRTGENLMVSLWATAGAVEVIVPFERLTFAEAMERFGTDRPDARFGMELTDASDIFRYRELEFARKAVESGGRVRSLIAPGAATFSRKQVSELEAIAKSAGAGGLMNLRYSSDGGSLEGSIARYLDDAAAGELGLQPGDMAFLVAGRNRISGAALSAVRLELARRLQLIPENVHRFLWVTDFPLFSQESAEGALEAEHHPFTAPHPNDLALLDITPGRARSLAYDLVYNGLELASGSIRISDPALQQRILSLLGIDNESAERRFGFLLEGLRSGAPPHGGIAFGFDRIAMLLAGATSLRDVIAFPKTTAARALFEGAPAQVPVEDLRELHIELRKVQQ